MNREQALETLYWRDEILQVLFWLRGEGIGREVAPRDLVNLLQLDERATQQHLERLVADGLVVREESEPPAYALTANGVREGARRFADEFAGLTGQAHGECSDPNCACHTLGPEACHVQGGQAT